MQAVWMGRMKDYTDYDETYKSNDIACWFIDALENIGFTSCRIIYGQHIQEWVSRWQGFRHEE